MKNQLGSNIIKVLRESGVPASTRLQNAAVLLIKDLNKSQDENDIMHSVLQMQQQLMYASFNITSIRRVYLNFMIECLAGRAKHVQDEIKKYFGADDEAQIEHPEATGVPPSKEAVRFAKKQNLICQVLIYCSDAQTMTGIHLSRIGVG